MDMEVFLKKGKTKGYFDENNLLMKKIKGFFEWDSMGSEY